MATLKDDWYAVPYENESVSAKLEDIAQAANLPRLAIWNPSKTCEEAQIKDCKSIITRNQSMAQAVADVLERLSQ